MPDLNAQLREDVAEIDWKSLIPHAQRDAIIIVETSLDLVEVAVALVQDDVAQVDYWIQESLIHKPTSDDLGRWNQDPSRQFIALIVQPFVLIRE